VGSAALSHAILTSLAAAGADAEHFTLEPTSMARTRADMASCAVLLVCAATEADALQILADDARGVLWSLRPGTIVVLHTPVVAQRMDELAIRCARYDLALVEAPVVGHGGHAWSDGPTILAGGAPLTIDAVEPLMRTWAATVIRTGQLGSAARTLLVNELLFAANLQLAGDALEIGVELGLDQKALLDALVACTSASISLRIIKGAGTTTAFAKAAERCHARQVTAASAATQSLGADLGLIGETLRRGQFALLAESPSGA
jgi:3-hydroxyisobutyrate dehydrogenase-like beta-hydroxyacid dehydrogenase